MSPKRIPAKPDRYKRGGIYICNLPTQTVTEMTDGLLHHRDGIERHGPRPCVVISSDNFNDTQARELIVVPTIGGNEARSATYTEVPRTWVRVVVKGEIRYVLAEQVRCIDHSRCKTQTGELVECDLRMVENKLKQLLFQ